MLRLEGECMCALNTVKRGAETVVLKTYQEKDALHFEAERRALAELNGLPGIVTVFALRDLQITMKYYPQGDLYSLVARLNETDQRLPVARVKLYARELLRALETCHSRGVAHMDVKLDNILLDEQGIVLTDFGMAVTKRVHAKQQGTAMYMAPEVYTPHFEGHCYDTFNADMWSFAATMFVLLRGSPPFHYPSVDCPFYRAYTGSRQVFWDYYKVPADAAAFIEDVMVVTRRLEEKRPSASEALAHAWLN
jgi:serine/threonine protein kinase